MTNKYLFAGENVEVTYTPGATPGTAIFIYKDPSGTKSFSTNQVRRSATDIGELATVTLVEHLGAPGETFTVLVPSLGAAKAPVHFKTIGVRTSLRGPALVNDFVPTNDVVYMKGTAENTKIPL